MMTRLCKCLVLVVLTCGSLSVGVRDASACGLRWYGRGYYYYPTCGYACQPYYGYRTCGYAYQPYYGYQMCGYTYQPYYNYGACGYTYQSYCGYPAQYVYQPTYAYPTTYTYQPTYTYPTYSSYQPGWRGGGVLRWLLSSNAAPSEIVEAVIP